MLPLHLLDDLSPHARVLTAVAPFVAAIVMRVMLGKGRLTGWLVTLSTLWFVVNVLLAPYSMAMRQDLERFGNMLR